MRALLARRPIDREILRLAVPALGALVAEPLFLLADSAMVGHLGETPLAGLAIASAILQTAIGLMVFLAYTTTPAVARRVGAGNVRGAISVGIDGIWLALGLGVVIALLGWFTVPHLVGLFGAPDAVAEAASAYLSWSLPGIPAMLVVFAATGLLRGLQDTRTPLWIAGIGFAANIGLNFLFMYGLNMGIAGSALGTVVAQWGMVAVYLLVIGRHARREGASIWPQRTGVLGGATSGGWLFLRTLSLRASLLLGVFVATDFGPPELAAYQVTMTLYSTLAFALDALAIAAQALVGKGLGAGDTDSVRAVLRRCLEWGVGGGAVLGLLLAATAWAIPPVFTTSPEVTAALVPALLVLAVSVPLGGLVFVLDGVLIGAGDARFLALAGLVNLATFVPMALAVMWFAPAGPSGLAWLTAAVTIGYLGSRAITLALRARGGTWMRVGA